MTASRLVLSCLVLPLLAPSCRDARDTAPPPVEKPATPSPSRGAVGLLGTWVRNPPLDVRHDTLVLRAHSSATGWTREYHGGDTVFAVAQWKVAFLSRDPVVARADMPGRYQDGGDYGCFRHPDSTCVSAPVFCLGPLGRLDCQGMTFRGDTLWLSNEGRFVRIANLDNVVP